MILPLHNNISLLTLKKTENKKYRSTYAQSVTEKTKCINLHEIKNDFLEVW